MRNAPPFFVASGEASARESRESFVAQIACVDRHAARALTQNADHVHRSHRPRRADDVDRVALTDLGARRNRGEGRGRIDAGGSDDTNAAIVDAADLRLDRTSELPTALDDRQQAARGEFGKQFLRSRGVGAEIDDVVIGPVRQVADGGAGCRVGGRRSPRTSFHRGAINGGVPHDEQAAAGLQRSPLNLGVGVLDARPRLDQRERRRRQILGRRDEHRFAFRRSDDPLVQQHVFLQPALEVVAEGGVGLVGRQPAVVGLDDEPLARLVAVDPRPDLDDANDGFVAWDGRRVARHVIRHFRQRLCVEPGQDFGLTTVRGELLEQLEIGEAQTDRLDLGEHLMRSRIGDRLGRVELELVGADQLDGAFRLRNVVHGVPLSPVGLAIVSARRRRRARQACLRRRAARLAPPQRRSRSSRRPRRGALWPIR